MANSKLISYLVKVIHFIRRLSAASINEDNYSINLLGNDIGKIANYLRDTHEKDSDTRDPITPVEDMLGTFDELKKDNASQAQMIMYSNLFKINFTKMDPYKFKTFTDILQCYSALCKPVRGNSHNQEKCSLTKQRLVRENSRNSFSRKKRRTNTCQHIGIEVRP